MFNFIIDDQGEVAMKNGWKLLGYQAWDGDIEDRLVSIRERDGNYGAQSAHSDDYVWMIRKEYAVGFEFDLSHDSSEVSFKEGRLWHTGLWWGLVFKGESDIDAVIRIALADEGVGDKDWNRWEVAQIGPKCYTVKERGPAQQAAYEKQALQSIDGLEPRKIGAKRL